MYRCAESDGLVRSAVRIVPRARADAIPDKVFAESGLKGKAVMVHHGLGSVMAHPISTSEGIRILTRPPRPKWLGRFASGRGSGGR